MEDSQSGAVADVNEEASTTSNQRSRRPKRKTRAEIEEELEAKRTAEATVLKTAQPVDSDGRPLKYVFLITG